MLSMPRIVRPDPHRIRGTELGSPAGPATRRSIKRNKELREISTSVKRRQSKSRAAAAACGEPKFPPIRISFADAGLIEKELVTPHPDETVDATQWLT